MANSSAVSVGMTRCNSFVTGERVVASGLRNRKRHDDIDNADSFDSASAVGISERPLYNHMLDRYGRQRIRLRRLRAAALGLSASTSERFDDAASAFEHHMELALMIRLAGWTAPRDSPHHAVAEA